MVPIKDSENYLISQSGDVFSKKSNKFLSHTLCSSTGYYKVWVNGKSQSLHRLLAKTFLENPGNKPVVRHLNDIRTDNRLENLAWGTYSDNQKDTYKNGYKNHNRKLTEEQVRYIRDTDIDGVTLGKKFGVTKTTISYIRKNKSYAHKLISEAGDE